jgi:tRNA1Val (adenine37-N6)-methyltransferase
MILAHRHPEITLAGIEIQPALAGTAMENILENRLENRVSIISGDALDLPGRDFTLQDLVLSNPPFTPYGKGRINPSDEKAIARHEIRMTLEALVTTAASLLTNIGRFAVIYPESRCGELLACLERHGLPPVRLRRIHPLAGGPAKRVLVEAAKGVRSSLTVEPSLAIYSEKGIFSDEVKNMFL